MSRVFCGAVVVGLTFTLPHMQAEEKTETKEKKEEFKLSDDEKTILDLTNQERARQSLPALKPHPLLFKAAREHTENMARLGRLSHSLNGTQPHQRIRETGYVSFGSGENIASGRSFPAREAFDAWMSSSGHRRNILNGTYGEIGIGVATNERGETYYTQVFARPAGEE